MKQFFYHYLFIALAITFLSMPAAAHHNWAAHYDVKGDIEIEGEISEINWRNPHVRISFKVDAGSDKEKVYSTESNSVASLTRMGVTKELLSVGTKVKVAGYPSRSTDSDLFMNHLLLPSGKEMIFLRTAEPRWPDAERIGNTDIAHGRVTEDDFSKRPTSVFAVWSTIFGAEGSHRSLKSPKEGYSIDYAEPRGTDNCVSKDIWSQMGSPYPMQLLDKQATVIIHAEEHDSIRTVYMEGVPEDESIGKNNLGLSTGRWAGETLLVTTTFERSNSPIQIHESFTLSGNHSRLNYSQTLIDPASNELPVINHKWWEYVPGSFVQPYNCI